MEKLRILAAAIAVSAASVGSAAPNLTIGDPAPPIAVAKWVQGTPVTNGAGGLRVVEFWATWCGPCKESIPHLTELSKKYQGKVTFTGVDVFERSPDDVKTVQAFLKTMGPKMAYNVAVDDKAGTMGKTWMEAAHQPGIPTAFIVDKRGQVVWIGHPMNGLDTALDQLIAGTYDVKKAKAAFAAEMATQNAEAAAQAKNQAQQDALEESVKNAFANYKAGKKAEALAAMNKDVADATDPDLKRQLKMLTFQMILPDDKPAASAIVEAEAKAAGPQSTYAYLQFGMMATSPNPKAPSKDDAAFGIELADKALKLAPTDPIVDFEAAMIYGQTGNYAKAISLSQDALKNIGNAKPEIQERLKTAVNTKLREFQSHKS